MKKAILVLLFAMGIICSKTYANDGVEYTNFPSSINYEEMTPDEDEFYAGTDIRPIEKEMSEEEQSQPNSTDVNFIEEDDKLPELKCSDTKLKKQVESFIYNYINKINTNSVIEKRDRLLLVRNLHDFSQVSEDDISGKENYTTMSLLAHLKINEHRTIYRICKSVDNKSKNFKNLYVIIYQYLNYYKVVVPNLISTPQQIEDATFTYSW